MAWVEGIKIKNGKPFPTLRFINPKIPSYFFFFVGFALEPFAANAKAEAVQEVERLAKLENVAGSQLKELLSLPP